MDGDDRRRKSYGTSAYQVPTSSSASPAQSMSFQSGDPFAPPSQQTTRGGSSRSSLGRSSILPGYGGYGFSEQPSYAAPQTQSSTLQGGNIQYQANFPQDSSRQRQSPQIPPQQQYPIYGQNIVYNITPQASAQAPYDTVPQFQQRQSAAIEVLSNQFGIPQYFARGEPTTAGLPVVQQQYLTSQAEPTSYTSPYTPGLPSIPQSYQVEMSEYPTIVPPDPPDQPHETSTTTDSLEEAYQRSQAQLKVAFEALQAGNLAEASEELMSSSRWFLSNLVTLGLHQDEAGHHAERILLWRNFNLCWLALGQKQRDYTEEMFAQRASPVSVLPSDALQRMLDELLRHCDQIEQHGLVDYEMGVWEEEIVSLFSQCMDLLGSSGNRQTYARGAGPPHTRSG